VVFADGAPATPIHHIGAPVVGDRAPDPPLIGVEPAQPPPPHQRRTYRPDQASQPETAQHDGQREHANHGAGVGPAQVSSLVPAEETKNALQRGLGQRRSRSAA
jgi:hypothetical protein